MDRRRCVKIAVVTCSIALGLVQVYASRPPFMTRSKTRPCYANQKTIVGAIEMYNLDKNTKRIILDRAFFEDLRSGGYLQEIPQDPGGGPGSSGNYRLTGAGNGISCAAHGQIQ